MSRIKKKPNCIFGVRVFNGDFLEREPVDIDIPTGDKDRVEFLNSLRSEYLVKMADKHRIHRSKLQIYLDYSYVKHPAYDIKTKEPAAEWEDM